MAGVGTYLLVLSLRSEQRIWVGALGEIEFPAGWYLYAGSALGPGGLHARLARHQRRLTTQGMVKRAHWHVDYLREYADWGGAWIREGDRRLECDWAAALRRLPASEVVAPGFGASDCGCPAHLVRVPTLPADGWFAANLGAQRSLMGQDEIDKLVQQLQSGEDESREVAALALGRMGPAAIEPLVAMLGVEQTDIRWWAARALAEVGGPGAVLPLIGVLTDPDPDVRACAVLALGRIGDARAAAAVAERLTDDSAFVAGIAADALTMIGEPAVTALAAALSDERPHVRLLAVRALGRLRSQSGISPLFGALEDPSYLVRYYAQEALEALGVGMVYLAP